MTDTEKPEPAPTTAERIDFARLDRAMGLWHVQQGVIPEDIPWLIEIARTVRYFPVSPEDVALLESAAKWLAEDQADDFPDGLRSLASRIALLLPPPAPSESPQ